MAETVLLAAVFELASGLGFYLPCSFLDNPRFGHTSPSAQRADLTSPAPLLPWRGNLDRHDRRRAEAWGAFLWELRTLIGPEAMDELACHAWLAATRGDGEIPELAFADHLLTHLPRALHADTAGAARRVFARRKVRTATRIAT